MRLRKRSVGVRGDGFRIGEREGYASEREPKGENEREKKRAQRRNS